MMVSCGFNACSTIELIKPLIDYTADCMVNAFYVGTVFKCLCVIECSF